MRPVASVCVSVCNGQTFESLDQSCKVHFWRQIHLQNRQVMFVYQGHGVKVKVKVTVTEAKRVPVCPVLALHFECFDLERSLLVNVIWQICGGRPRVVDLKSPA